MFHPIAQAVQDEPPNDGVVGVEGVARAAEIRVAGRVGFEEVINGIVQTAQAERGPGVVPFGGVIEDHIQNDFQAFPVQGFHHVPELIYRPERVRARAVGLVRREERNRRVAPIVHLARWTVLGIELKDRQQLDRRHPELLQIGNLLDQAGIGSSQILL